MPGEERKFKRRRIVAFPPNCKRDLGSATSHASLDGGVSTTGVVVTVASTTGVAVGVDGGRVGVET